MSSGPPANVQQQPAAALSSGQPATKPTSTMHSFIVSACKFTVDKKYVPLKALGRGAYATVCSAQDKTSNDKKVAIKKIGKAFDDLVDAKRIVREVKLLRHFKHDNLIGLYDLVPPLDSEPFEDIYIVLEYMDTDLHQIIYSKNELTDQHIQYFVYQILRGLKFIHSANVIHRDLKPSNLLLNESCDLKICDFGLARGIKGEESKQDYDLTEYVVTRWYRAPEILCSCKTYDTKIDVWAVGCIFAEIIGRKPLFPGQDYLKQLDLIFGTLGTPTDDELKFISNSKAVEYIKGLKKQKKNPFTKIYPKASPAAIDLLEKMLQFDPNKRISVVDALKHPYLKELHDEKLEPECKDEFGFEWEKAEMTKEQLQEFMWDEILLLRPHLKDKHALKVVELRAKAKQKAELKKNDPKKTSTSSSTSTSTSSSASKPAQVNQAQQQQQPQQQQQHVSQDQMQTHMQQLAIQQ